MNTGAKIGLPRMHLIHDIYGNSSFPLPSVTFNEFEAVCQEFKFYVTQLRPFCECENVFKIYPRTTGVLSGFVTVYQSISK